MRVLSLSVDYLRDDQFLILEGSPLPIHRADFRSLVEE